MSRYPYSERSLAAIYSCHPDLQRVAFAVAEHCNVTVLCGHRGKAEQDEAFKHGRSRVEWPDSPHSRIPSEAIDMVPYPIDWLDEGRLRFFAGFVCGLAVGLDPPVEIKWGGYIKGLADMPHYRLVLSEPSGGSGDGPTSTDTT